LYFLRRKRKPVQMVEVSSALPPAGANAEKTAGQADSAQLSPQAALEPAIAKLQLPPMTKKVEFLRDHLKENVRQDPAFAASVLRGWLEEDAK
jgi:hypothetical protein